MRTHLTEKDLAKRWGVTTRTLQNWRRDSKGPAFMDIGNNTIRYRMEDVEAYEERNLKNKKEV